MVAALNAPQQILLSERAFGVKKSWRELDDEEFASEAFANRTTAAASYDGIHPKSKYNNIVSKYNNIILIES